MHLGSPELFWPLLVLFLAGTVLALATLRRDRRDLDLLGKHHFVLEPEWVFGRRVLKAVILSGALFLALLGSARLQGKPAPDDLRLRGIDVMVVLDLSKSMLTEDIIPNRLEAAKKALMNWLPARDGDRVGLVVFAGEALVQVPLTMDLEAASLVLSRDDVDAVDRGGTDIGNGIRTALAGFPKDGPDKRGRAILLMTDGELTEGSSNVTEACLEAQTMKVPIVAVGIGTRQGRPIPAGTSFWGDPEYKKDRSGNRVVSRLDEQTLGKIAEMTGGAFVHGDNPASLASIDKVLDVLPRTSTKGTGAEKPRELSPALGAFTAAILTLSLLI